MTNNQTVPTIQVLEEIKVFYKKRGNLQRLCDEVGFEYKTMYGKINGDIGKLSIMHTIIMDEWMKVWKRQEVERIELKREIDNG